MTPGSNLVYKWLPNTAADTSNPLPTLPCAWQCTYCARLCAKRLPSFESSSVDSASSGMTSRWTRRAEVRDVMRAADEPSPVLWTSARWTPVGTKGGILVRESRVRGRLSSSSCGSRSAAASQCCARRRVAIAAHLGPLGVEVIVPSDRDVESTFQCSFDRFCAFGFDGDNNRLVQGKTNELVLARTKQRESMI